MDNSSITQINRALQSIVYWMASKSALGISHLHEAEIVGEAENAIGRVFQNCIIRREVPYSDLGVASGQYADLAVFSKDSNRYECIIEFKLGNGANGGYNADVQKINAIKTLNKDVTCLVIIAYQNSCSYKVPMKLVTNEGKASRKTLTYKNVQFKVRRVCNALSSRNSTKIKKVICLEVI